MVTNRAEEKRKLFVDDPAQLRSLIRHHIIQMHQASVRWKLEAVRIANENPDRGVALIRSYESMILRDATDSRKTHAELAASYAVALRALHPEG